MTTNTTSFLFSLIVTTLLFISTFSFVNAQETCQIQSSCLQRQDGDNEKIDATNVEVGDCNTNDDDDDVDYIVTYNTSNKWENDIDVNRIRYDVGFNVLLFRDRAFVIDGELPDITLCLSRRNGFIGPNAPKDTWIWLIEEENSDEEENDDESNPQTDPTEEVDPTEESEPIQITPVSPNQYYIADVSYPSNPSAGQSFRPVVRVCVNSGTLSGSRGDMLLTADGNTYQAFRHVAMEGTIGAGQCHNFEFYENDPMVAPTQDGTYESRWQIWANGQWVSGTEVIIRFTVGGGGSTPLSNQAILYDDPDFNGESRSFGVGQYNLDDFNDRGHSLKLPDGWSALLAEHSNLEGQTMCFTTDTSSLPGPYSEGVSSLRVYDNSSCSGGSDNSSSEQPITLFDNPDYKGTSYSFGVGEHDISGIWNDAAHSILVRSGSAFLFEHANFEGQSICIETNTSSLPSPFAEGVSSLIVYDLSGCSQNQADIYGDNWCYPGQPWGDGRCNDPNPDIEAFNWNLGWYMYQLSVGNLTCGEIPVEYQNNEICNVPVPLPVTTETPDPSVPPVPSPTPPTPPPIPAECRVTSPGVYLIDGGGNELKLTTSAPNLASMSWNDRAVEIRVDGPYEVYVYDNQNYDGYERGPYYHGWREPIGNNVSSVKISIATVCP